MKQKYFITFFIFIFFTFPLSCNNDTKLEKLSGELNDAIRANSLSKVEKLLEKGADPNRMDRNNDFPVSIATVYDNLPALKLLVKYGGSLAEAKYKIDAFTIAVRRDNKEIAGYCLDQGIDLSQNRWPTTPLEVAVVYASPTILHYLIFDRGLDPLEKDENGNNLLHSITLLEVPSNERYEVAENLITILLDQGLSFSDYNNDGLTPLHKALIQRNSSELIFSMLGLGADPLEVTLKDYSYQTKMEDIFIPEGANALDIVIAMSDYDEIKEYLEEEVGILPSVYGR